MLAFHLLLLPAVVGMVTGSSCVCDRLFIKGLDPTEFPFTQSHEGIYKRHPNQDPSVDPIYIHETQPMQLQVEGGDHMVFQPLNGAQPRLSIQIKSGFNVASWLNIRTCSKKMHKHPLRKIIQSWVFHDDFTGEKRTLSSDVQLQCADDNMHRCSANALRFSHSISQKLNGEFYWAVENNEVFVQAVGRYLNQRPVYYSTISGKVLFYANSSWGIAATLMSDPIVRARDNAYLPEYISAFWEVSNLFLDTQEWKVKRHLHLVCAESIVDVLGPLFSWCSNVNPCQHSGSCFRQQLRDGVQHAYCLCRDGYSGALCENYPNRCPQPPMPGIRLRHISFKEPIESQTFGDIAVMYYEKEQYFTSVCGLTNDGNAKWRPDNRVIGALGHLFLDADEVETTSVLPSTSTAETSASAETSVEQASSSSTEESTTLAYETTTYAPFLNSSMNSTTEDTTDITSDATTDTKTDAKPDAEIDAKTDAKTEARSLSAFLLNHAFIGASLAVLCLFPGYMYIQIKKAQKDMDHNPARREHHIKELSELYEQRDRSVQALQSKHPKLVFSREDGVFVKDASGYTQSEKEEIAREYHRLHNQFVMDTLKVEQSHQNTLKKIRVRKAWCLYLLVLYCYTVMLLSSLYFFTHCVLGWENHDRLFISLLSWLLSYAALVAEALLSEEGKNVLNMKSTTILKHLDRLKKEQPLLIMAAEVYRHDVRVNMECDKSGAPSHMYTTHNKVVVGNQYCTYDYTAWKDTSAEFAPCDPAAIYKLTVGLEIDFSDPELYEQHWRELKEICSMNNHLVDFTYHTFLCNSPPEVVLAGESTPWWLKSRLLFVLASLFTMSWTLRQDIRQRTIPAKFTLRKTLFNTPGKVADAEAVPYDKKKAAKGTVKIVEKLRGKKQTIAKSTRKPIYRGKESLTC